MAKAFITYEPDNSLKKGYFNLLREIIDEIRWNKYLTYQLFRRDFFAMYKQSFVGIFWAFALPLLSIATFVLLDRSGIFNAGKMQMPYPLYAILGMTFWQYFSSGITSGANAVSSAGPMIVRINFSKKSLVLASMGRAFVVLIVQLGISAILFIYYKFTPAPEALLIPLILIPMTLFILALSFIFSLFNAFLKDVGNGLQVLMTFLMFLTPVLYAKPTSGFLAKVTAYNPIYFFIAAGRDLASSGKIQELNGFLISSVVSVVLFFVCVIFFHLTETRVAERM